jgi:hypothetical protein
MHLIDVLRDVTSEERPARQEPCLAEQRWAPVLAQPLVENAPQRSARAQAQQVLISTRVASVIADVTNSKLINLDKLFRTTEAK